MNYLQKFVGHLKTICTHKKWVGYYCFKAGLYWQGITHDLSKFSPTEFLESVKYYTGTHSPIDGCKKDIGYSMAWFHHKGRNKHHYEHWVDNLDNGGVAVKMPYKYALEMVCDYLGAGKAYFKDEFTYEREWNWWLNKSSKPCLMHPDTKLFIHNMLKTIYKENSIDCLKFNRSWVIYKESKV